MTAPAPEINDTDSHTARWTVELWEAVGRLLDASTVAGIRAHGLGALLWRRLRDRDEPIPEMLDADAWATTLTMLVCRPLLERIRESCEGPLVLMKGPEVARLYPDSTRTFTDIDLLVPDAPAVHRQLKELGFVEVGEPALFYGIHHLQPLQWPSLPLAIELHTRPKWVEGLEPPSTAALIEAAVPSGLGVEGVSALDPVHHALAVAVHHWAHVPLAHFRDMIDVLALSAESTEAELERMATAWGIRRLWLTSLHAAKGAVGLEESTAPLRVWARHLRPMRERSVLENHLQSWLSPYWALKPTEAFRVSGHELLKDLRPAFDEGWRDKLTRVAEAVRHPWTPLSVHQEKLGDAATRGQGRNPPPGEE